MDILKKSPHCPKEPFRVKGRQILDKNPDIPTCGDDEPHGAPVHLSHAWPVQGL